MFTLRRYESADREAVEYLHVYAIQQTGAYLGRGPSRLSDPASRHLHTLQFQPRGSTRKTAFAKLAGIFTRVWK